MIILVCGGRDFNFKKLIFHVLDTFSDDLEEHGMKIEKLVHGGAPGVDTISGQWAEKEGIEVEVYPADWKQYGKRAGYIRNQQMLKEGNPDGVLAFPGGKGTKMMVKLAKSAKVSVIDFNDY